LYFILNFLLKRIFESTWKIFIKFYWTVISKNKIRKYFRTCNIIIFNACMHIQKGIECFRMSEHMIWDENIFVYFVESALWNRKSMCVFVHCSVIAWLNSNEILQYFAITFRGEILWITFQIFKFCYLLSWEIGLK
jgi:hypothetical protein